MSDRIRKLLENGEYEKVIEILEGKFEKAAEDYTALGVSYYSIGKRNKAVSNLKKALQMDPKNTDALFNLAEIFLQLEKYSKAKEYALKLVQISPNDWAAHDILAEVYKFEGFYDKAVDHLREAIRSAPSEVIHHLRERLSALRERIEKAKDQRKLAIICAKGLDTFIDDIVKGLSDEYWVQRWAVTNDKEIKTAIDWADIVWLEWANEVAIIGTNYAGSWVKPLVIRLHSYEIFTDMPLKIHWPAVNVLIFVAPHIREILFERFPELRSKIRRTEIVYNGIDLSKVPFKERKPGYEIAWVGHVNYKKAPELALQIIKKLVDIDSRYRLHFAGDFQDPRYEIYMKHMVKLLGLENNVIFYGWVDDMDEFWEDKNYLLHTSLHEGHPYAVMEAMARGVKPVIHWFRGAEKLYKIEWLFKTIDEAIEILTNGFYNSGDFRKHVEEYSLTNQVSSIIKIISSLSDDFLFEMKTFNTHSKEDMVNTFNRLNFIKILEKYLNLKNLKIKVHEDPLMAFDLAFRSKEVIYSGTHWNFLKHLANEYKLSNISPDGEYDVEIFSIKKRKDIQKLSKAHSMKNYRLIYFDEILLEDIKRIISKSYDLFKVNKASSEDIIDNIKRIFSMEYSGAYLMIVPMLKTWPKNFLSKIANRPKVSVAVPFFNAENYIRSFVEENILNDTYENSEYVFVNDGSTDKSLDLLKTIINEYELNKKGKIQIVSYEKNKGLLFARYEGLKAASGDFVVFYDIDDIAPPDHLETLILENHNIPEDVYTPVANFLMYKKHFSGEVWWSKYYSDSMYAFYETVRSLSGRVSFVYSLFPKKDLERAYGNLMGILLKLGLRITIGEDILALFEYLVSSGKRRIIPILHTGRGYERGGTNISKNVDRRIKELPFLIAYIVTSESFMKRFPGEYKKIDEYIEKKARSLYGFKGDDFLENYHRFKLMLIKVKTGVN